MVGLAEKWSDSFSRFITRYVVFPIDKLDFQRPEKTLHRCVVIATIPTRSDLMFAKQTLEVITAVLGTPIAGKDPPFFQLAK